MSKILFPALLAFFIGSAFAQSGNVSTKTDGSAMTAAEKSAEAFCLRETGSHLRAIKNVHNERAVECAKSPGRVYTREDIERTGAINTADALRRLDPSIR